MERLKMKILNELETSKSIWELLESLHYPIRDVLSAIRDLREEGFIVVESDGLKLTQEGRRFVGSRRGYTSSVCGSCQGRRVVFGDVFYEVLKEFKSIVKGRPQPSLSFFQGFMVEEDVVCRVAFMHHYGDVEGKEVVLIGDDDLVSVALSLTDLPKRVCVLDIDERIGEFLKSLRRSHGLDIEFRRYDIADPLPQEFTASFDVFSSEPLETFSGLKGFLGRGISCLREYGVGYFGVTILEASYKKWRAVENFCIRSNCVLTDIVRDFSSYPMRYETVNYESFASKLGLPTGEKRNWYRSTLFRLEALGKPKVLVDPLKRLRVQTVDRKEDVTHPLYNLDLYRF